MPRDDVHTHACLLLLLLRRVKKTIAGELKDAHAAARKVAGKEGGGGSGEEVLSAEAAAAAEVAAARPLWETTGSGSLASDVLQVRVQTTTFAIRLMSCAFGMGLNSFIKACTYTRVPHCKVAALPSRGRLLYSHGTCSGPARLHWYGQCLIARSDIARLPLFKPCGTWLFCLCCLWPLLGGCMQADAPPAKAAALPLPTLLAVPERFGCLLAAKLAQVRVQTRARSREREGGGGTEYSTSVGHAHTAHKDHAAPMSVAASTSGQRFLSIPLYSAWPGLLPFDHACMGCPCHPIPCHPIPCHPVPSRAMQALPLSILSEGLADTTAPGAAPQQKHSTSPSTGQGQGQRDAAAAATDAAIDGVVSKISAPAAPQQQHGEFLAGNPVHHQVQTLHACSESYHR